MKGRAISQRYELVAPLARGGMGTVWRARDRELERDVAVKLMADALTDNDEARMRFRREARAIARLKSPNVVTILDHGIDDTSPFMVMELLEGEDLGRVLRRNGPEAPSTIVSWLRQLGQAVSLVHDAGIVHRDIKPSNLFVARTPGGDVLKLVDFGVAKVVQSGEDSTATGLTVGSVRYMAPEQVRAEKSLDHRADLWSIAVVAYVALTGKLPFSSDSDGAMAVAICTEPHMPPSSAHPSLGTRFDAFFQKALAKSPAKRFASATELVAAFASAVESTEPETSPTVPAIRSPERLPRVDEADEARDAVDPTTPAATTNTGPAPARSSWKVGLGAVVVVGGAVAAIAAASASKGTSSLVLSSLPGWPVVAAPTAATSTEPATPSATPTARIAPPAAVRSIPGARTRVSSPTESAAPPASTIVIPPSPYHRD